MTSGTNLRRILSGPLLLAPLALALCARSWHASARHLAPAFDEVAYLELARDFAERGGVAEAVGCHWRGECREDNRHPLYSMMLAPFVEPGPEDFPRAKLLTLATAMLALGTLYAAARASRGPEAALLAAALFALNWGAALVSQRVLADFLFAALWLGALALLARRPADVRAWAGFGALSGLAWLAKGNGHLLLAAGLAWGLFRSGPGLLKRAEPWAAALAFAAVGSFLLRRNLLVWGSPFHNFNATVIWLDDWPSVWAALSSPERWAEVGPASWWARHGAADAARRLGEGLLVQGRLALEALGAGPLATHRLAGAAVAALAAYGLRLRSREGREGRAEAALLLGASALLVLPLAWGAAVQSTGIRLLLPLTLMALPHAASGALTLGARLPALARAFRKPSAPAALLLACCAAAVAGAADGLSRDPRRLWAVSVEEDEASRWLAERAGDAGFALSHLSPFSAWHCCRDRRRPFPPDAPAEELRAFMERTRTPYLLVDAAVGAEAPAGWPLCWRSSGAPPRFRAHAPAPCPGGPR